MKGKNRKWKPPVKLKVGDMIVRDTERGDYAVFEISGINDDGTIEYRYLRDVRLLEMAGKIRSNKTGEVFYQVGPCFINMKRDEEGYFKTTDSQGKGLFGHSIFENAVNAARSEKEILEWKYRLMKKWEDEESARSGDSNAPGRTDQGKPARGSRYIKHGQSDKGMGYGD